MSLVADEKNASSGARLIRCPVASLDDDLRAETVEALAQVDGRTLTVKGIAAALRQRGASVSDQGLRRHHRGDCCCEPG